MILRDLVAHLKELLVANPLALIMQFVSQVTDFVKYVKVHVLTCITFGTTIATESHISSSLRGNPI